MLKHSSNFEHSDYKLRSNSMRCGDVCVCVLFADICLVIIPPSSTLCTHSFSLCLFTGLKSAFNHFAVHFMNWTFVRSVASVQHIKESASFFVCVVFIETIVEWILYRSPNYWPVSLVIVA